MNKYYERQITAKIQKLILHFPCVVIIGARQVGKSTLLKKLFPDYNYVLFDPVEDVENARQDPDFFLNNRPSPLILDEIQYAPELVAAIKKRIDKDRKPGQFILTGSQQWGIMNNLSESLAGRAMILELEPLAIGEIANNPPEEPWLERYLDNPVQFVTTKNERLQLPLIPYEHIWRGLFPDAVNLPKDIVVDFHSSYQKTYVERDVRLLANIGDLQQFTRFVRLIAALTAQEINYNEVGRELGIDGSTAKRWLNILRETFEWHEIPAYSKNAIKKISSKPKGYFADTGQVCFSQAIAKPNNLASHPLWGAIFENFVVNEIRKQCNWMSSAPNIFHWRSYSGAECDLILEYNGKYFPIVIKTKSHPTKNTTSGIKAFKKCYPKLDVPMSLVICFTEQIFPIEEGIYALPWNIR